ncbi:lipopolysaccharide heptosyltransferase RfaC [Leminorella grimontii]|uniref:lipopolysaccharide heptosyltransferase RfaC n=1 Tax=Leminorella grimontii TaxID=82981 RepID=UPI0032206943
MRVLIVKTSSMGDVLHTLAALTDAQRAIADIRFDWVVEEGFAQIPSWHSAVDRVIPVAIRRWRKSWFHAQTRKERQAFKARLQERQYDAVIDAQGLIKSAFLVTRKARGVKHGQDRRSAREPLASCFFDVKHYVAKNQHAVERTRQLFALSLGYPAPTEEGDFAIAERFLSVPPQDANRYLVFLHATTRDDKHWPERHWRELIAAMADCDLKIKLPWGAPREHERALRLAEGNPNVEVLPKLTLEEIARVLAGAKAVVSVDTGLSHMTAALGRPNLTLYGPTDPGLIGGYGSNQSEILAPGQDLNALSAQTVKERLLQIIQPGGDRPLE